MGIINNVKNYIIGKLRRAGEWVHSVIYKSELEVSKAKSWKNEKHREIRAELDAIIYALVQRVANLITARTPIFLDKAGNEIDNLREEWEKNLYNNLLNDVIQATRTHGYCVVESLKEKLDDRSWLVHDSTDIQQINYKKFNIEKYIVLPQIEQGEKTSITEVVTQYDLFPNDVIHFYIGKFKLNRQGVSAIKPIWDLAVRYNEMVDAMAEYDVRIGNGMMVLAVDPNDYQNQTSELVTAIKNTNTKSVLLLKQGMAGKAPTIVWEGSANKVEWEKDLGELMKLISGASGFPVRWFIGDPKGALSASKEDRIAVWTTLKEIFQEYIPFIRKLLLKQENGEALNEMVSEIVFDDGGNLGDYEDYDEGIEETPELEEQADKALEDKQKEKTKEEIKSEKNYVKKYD